MRRITTMAALSVLMLALTAGVALAVTATGSDRPDDQARPGAELSPKQRAEFVAVAKRVAGLNDAQVAAALKNPASLAAIPVRAEVQRTETQPAARAQEGERSPSAASTSYCRRFASTVNYFNAYGTLLASYKVSRVWCWNYSAITYVSVPSVSGTVTEKGAALGWRYDGVIAKSDYYFYYDGLSRGGHVSRRKGSFSVCNAASGCFLKKTPKVSIFGFYDGRGYQRSST